MSQKLFDNSEGSGEDEELQLGTNKDYAKSYNNLRKKELMQKYKDRGYDVNESDSSSDSESSEEDEAIDPQFDQEFFKTLASLKSKDPSIYDRSTRFFEGTGPGTENGEVKKEKKAKPVTLQEYERKILLEQGGVFEEDSDKEQHDDDDDEPQRSASPTVAEEERRLKAEFAKALNANDDDDSESESEATKDDKFGGIFSKRQKTNAEQAQEDEDFAQWLAGKSGDIQKEHKEKLQPLKNYWSKENLPQSERFLRDYILSKGYANAKASDIPTYDEIVGDGEEFAPLSEDEQELEKQADFEQKYNFRFEEPDADFIHRYPRTIENSVRRTDDKRKQHRQEVRERKAQEKEQIMKEFELVKEMKRREIEEKIRKLKLVTGNDELGFRDDELEEDFDPAAHDRRMQELFNEDYYGVDEGEEKPECPSDIDELKLEDWDNYDPKRAGGGDADDDEYGQGAAHCEDDDFNMDCDYDPMAAKLQHQQELIENSQKRRGGRKGRRNRFMEIIQSEKPAFNPDDEKTYAEYIDEYYQLDCEDVIGDLPCRFKYVETTPNDFGLTIEEILLAKNRELNQWASLKKAIQIRPEHQEKQDQRLYKMKAKNEDLKRKIFKSLYGEGSDDENDEDAGDSSQQQNTTDPKQPPENATPAVDAPKESKKARQRRKRRAALLNGSQTTASSEAEKAGDDGEEAPAKKPKVEGEVNTDTALTAPTTTTTKTTTEEDQGPKKKRKRNRKPQKNAVDKVNAPKSSLPTTTKTQEKQKSGGAAKSPSKPNPFKAKQTKDKEPKNNAVQQKPSTQKATAVNSDGKPNPFKAKEGKMPASATPRNNGFGNKFKAKLQPGFKPKSFNSKERNQGGEKAGGGGDSNITNERLKAYGINPRKFHKQQKYGNKQK